MNIIKNMIKITKDGTNWYYIKTCKREYFDVI